MPKQANGDANTFARENTVVVLVRNVPYFRKHGWRELRAAEYLDCDVARYNPELLRVVLRKYLVDERDLGWRGGKLGHVQ